jgi:hypothetical protein
MRTYEEEGFKVFSFVDSSWLSFEKETNKGTLLAAETYVASKTQEDDLWDTFLEEKLQGELMHFFMSETGAPSRYFDTQNIAYVDIYNRVCTIFRFIETSHNNRNMTVYNLSSSKIPLDQSLTLDSDNNHLTNSNVSEVDNRNIFLKNLMKKTHQLELEQRLKEEAEAKQKAEEEEKRSRLFAQQQEWLKQRQRVQDLENEEIEREMEERAKRAAIRPIGVDPNHWEKRIKNNTYTVNQIILPPLLMSPLKVLLNKWKERKKKR